MNPDQHRGSLGSRAGQGPCPREDGQARSLAVTVPRWSSEDLLRGQRTVEIEHRGEVYRLRSTRQGKLILTK